MSSRQAGSRKPITAWVCSSSAASTSAHPIADPGETGRILGEHEATVSRKLARTRTRIRERVEQALTRAHGLSPAEIELCYQYAMDQGIAMQEFGKQPF